MSEEDKTLMAQYGITSESKLMYSYKQHRYEHLEDAVNYARVDTNNAQKNNDDAPIEK